MIAAMIEASETKQERRTRMQTNSSKRRYTEDPEVRRKQRAGCVRRNRANPEKAMWTRARARAKRDGVAFSITDKDIKIPKLCPALGLTLEIVWGVQGGGAASPSLDRIIPELGYVPGNVQVISNRANRIKYNATLEELEAVTDYVRNL